MSDVTRLLDAAAAGDRNAAADLLPLVYDELRKLAAARMAAADSGHTLSATALVHEAYLRLVGDQRFDGRGHFFAAAAEAMRRVLVDHARAKGRQKRDGVRRQVALADIPGRFDHDPHLLLSLDDALTRLAAEDAGRPTWRSCTCSPGCRSTRRRRPSAPPVRPPTGTGLTPGPGCKTRSTRIRETVSGPAEHCSVNPED
jgi:RNA polymerase sigma factor (TIGR02999 family)